MAVRVLKIATAKQLPKIEAQAWQVARRLEIFGYSEIASEMSVSHKVATDLVSRWQAEGRVQHRQGGQGHSRKLFEVAPEHREPQDRTSQVCAQLWTGARGLKKFSPTDLAAHCRADLRVDDREASSYCQALLRAGYLVVLRTAIPGQREATYQLVRNSGPRAPREKRVAAVWDPNDAAYAYVAGIGQMGGEQ
ncbi:MAG: hypothetical protein BGP11_16050 [Rhodobacterales bacterium 65-51]|jgi:hypothetical protein|uniref:hypothetical protein n=1 Tax=uncultured Gemmobacter sp. TaxID=1095917 RepID=UPI000960F307|nr:hypothetical protein [uncultured Gemmobacter sp.]OJY35787.1 MAG: hypothetical protein BGP11_16050 [Rhodobacterales bacterium 65-51]